MSDNLYKFKHSNITLRDYIKDRNFKANMKRREAANLIKEAEAIENEMYELEANLLPVSESNDGSSNVS